MKKLNEEEFQNLPLKGKGRSSHVFNSIVNLKVGEAILIEKKDWSRKAGPSTLVRYIEKNHNMRFKCAALAEGNGWAVKRIEHSGKELPKIKVKTDGPAVSRSINEKDEQRLHLKSELVVFYLGRMAFHKIERIEESIKACMSHFWKQESELVKELFFEIINALAAQGHIVIENEKTYIPLRRT
ncbi:MAG: hypothetical protein J0L87_02685 [Bacteroidetes bacterium]|nr:hypothetical protein [Bacteroidia bacterium]MBN8695413.1 hypothetical protein [Bacteroidota bacterium]